MSRPIVISLRFEIVPNAEFDYPVDEKKSEHHHDKRLKIYSISTCTFFKYRFYLLFGNFNHFYFQQMIRNSRL